MDLDGSGEKCPDCGCINYIHANGIPKKVGMHHTWRPKEDQIAEEKENQESED
jgi:hypothetical protein